MTSARTQRVAAAGRHWAAYREFMRTARSAAVACGLTNEGGLERYCSRRFRQVAERNRRAGTRRALLQRQIDMVRLYCAALAHAPEHPAMVSMLQVLAAGVGSAVYQRELEKGFVDFLDFAGRQRERHEADAVQVADRQNRLLQVALRAYADSLALLHDERLDADEVQRRIAATRADVDVHVLRHGREQLVVEIDESLNKQVLYVKCEAFDFAAEEIERVEVAELDRMRNTSCHAEWLSVATRLFDAACAETPLHRSRGAVVVGHGVGGAVALGLAFLLHADGFEVKNCISFGAPKLAECTQQRVVDAISPIRVVLAGDPLVELPITGVAGNTFRHFGEILTMEEEQDRAPVPSPTRAERSEDGDPAGGRRRSSAGGGTAGKRRGSRSSGSAAHATAPDFGMQRYQRVINDDTAGLMYGAGEEVWDDGDYKQMLRASHSIVTDQKKWN